MSEQGEPMATRKTAADAAITAAQAASAQIVAPPAADANKVIERLLQRIAGLELDKAILAEQIAMLQAS
jgi:hypothetical protein